MEKSVGGEFSRRGTSEEERLASLQKEAKEAYGYFLGEKFFNYVFAEKNAQQPEKGHFYNPSIQYIEFVRAVNSSMRVGKFEESERALDAFLMATILKTQQTT